MAQMTSEIGILRTQVSDCTRSKLGRTARSLVDVGQISEVSSNTKGPNNVLTSKGVSEVPIFDSEELLRV